MKSLRVILAVLITYSFIACTQQGQSDEPTKPTIVVTTGMIADIMNNLVGDSMEVIPLMGPGVDPHQYTAVQSDLRKLEQANAIFYNGLHLEGKMVSIFEKMARTKPVFALSDGLDPDDLRSMDDNNAHDPHIWMDVTLWIKAARYASNQLCLLFPKDSTMIKSNCERYTSQLAALDQEVKRALQSIPDEQRVLITAHDAFGYFGKAYDIEVIGLQGISTVSEAGIKKAQELGNTIIRRKIRAIFVESSVPTKRMERLVESCQENGHNVRIGGQLYSDAMGTPGSGAETYEGMIRANVKTIVEALK